MLSRIGLVLTLSVLMNVGYAMLQVWLLRRCSPRPRFIERAIWAWAFTLIGLFFLQIFAPPSWASFLRQWLYYPLTVEMSWHVVLLIVFPVMIVVTLAVRLYQLIMKPQPAPLSEGGISRRNFLFMASYSAAPVVALGMGVHGMVERFDLRVRHLSIPIAGLPPELEGFSIAHVSDLHSGLFVGPNRLKLISDATNDLKADMVTITGDIINRSMEEFPAALAAMQVMESRHGTYLCEGNHDKIPGDDIVRNACTENNLPMLFNSTAIIPVRGKRLVIGGLPWINVGFEGHPEMISRLFPERQPGDVRILLAHYPHLFDIADSVDLVLSGHTHGGQIMLGEEVGLGPLFFKYWSGLYRRGNTAMVVSNGCGDWFPCRIGAPAEVALLRLTAA
jgi:predicted MPP superfamily phosphohydrolase